MHEFKTRAIQAYNSLRHLRLQSLPEIISIETSTACNRRCIYCPQGHAPIKQQVMTPELWYTCLYRLAELRWKSLVYLTHYNEFTLLPDCSRYVKELASLGCKPVIYSNGDRPERLLECLNAGAQRLYITKHPPTNENWLPNLQPVIKLGGHRVKMQELKVLHSHAGRLPDDAFIRPKYTQKSCVVPVNGVVVGVNGNIALCRLDYGTKHNFGDIRKDSLLEIWKRMAPLRSRLRKGEPVTDLCRNCMELEGGL